jgi:hypothetical protein
MTGQNRKADFLAGSKNDYQNANKDKVVSVEEWLKEAHAEPLFQKILDKLKITWEELEVSLKEAA